jgi:UDP-N-acetylmuramoyl-L-alanyl-D-glutamate--2,6-diaminopimelate ligase
MPLERTTPESTDLQRLLAHMREAGVDSVVMEVSSHALALHRADGIGFDVAGFTNLSQDHLDFHQTMDEYYAEKAKLFDPHRTAHGVINIADPYGARLAADVQIPITTVGVAPVEADVVAEVQRDDDQGLTISVVGMASPVSTDISLPGTFNVQNAVVSVGIADYLGIDGATMSAGLSSLERIPGRMERIASGEGPTVIVDYAHTPDAVSTVVSAARSLADGTVIVVLGAGGDRDRDKRDAMGMAAASHAGVVIVTNDNPRSESPLAIAEAVASGARRVAGSGVLVSIELDRRAAIREAIRRGSKGDVVLVLGKGHEQGQNIGGIVAPFDDASVVRDLLGIDVSGVRVDPVQP